MQNASKPMQNNKQYSNLSKKEKDKLHSKYCEIAKQRLQGLKEIL